VELSRGNLLASVGDLAGPALFVAVGLVGGSWRHALAIGATVMVAYALWLATLPFPPPHRSDDDEPPTPWRDALALLGDRTVWWLALVSALFSQLDEAYFAFFVASLSGERGSSTTLATALGTLLILGGLAGFAVLVRRPAGPRALVGAAVGMAVSAAVLAGVPALPALAAGAVGFGASAAVFWVAPQARLLRHRPERAASVSTVVSVLEQPGVLLPVAIGAIADSYGVGSAMGAYVVVPVVLALLARGRSGTPTPCGRRGRGRPCRPPAPWAGRGCARR
jgi:hypothetical protein